MPTPLEVEHNQENGEYSAFVPGISIIGTGTTIDSACAELTSNMRDHIRKVGLREVISQQRMPRAVRYRANWDFEYLNVRNQMDDASNAQSDELSEAA